MLLASRRLYSRLCRISKVGKSCRVGSGRVLSVCFGATGENERVKFCKIFLQLCEKCRSVSGYSYSSDHEINSLVHKCSTFFGGGA